MKKILQFFIKLYRKFLSPILPQSCRFTPSCSEYALEALEKHGAIKGTILSVYRVLRCNPFCRGGYDPVPDRFTLKRQEMKDNTGENND